MPACPDQQAGGQGIVVHGGKSNTEPRNESMRSIYRIAVHVALVLFLCLPPCNTVKPALSAERYVAETATADAYIIAAGGHLYRNGARLRQWGVNLQSGVFRSYAEIDNLIVRLKRLGFNAVRLWPTPGTFYSTGPAGLQANVSHRGDGSALDLFDYLVWRLSRSGMTIQMTALHYLDLPTLRAQGDEAIASWIASATSDAELRRLHGFAPYILKPYRLLLERHIEHVLARVNAYSGHRYADEPAVSAWELANEASFVSCSADPACVRSLPPIARVALLTAWEEYARRQFVGATPSHSSFSSHSHTAEFRQFVAERFIDVSKGLEETARRAGGAGSGVAVQPFIYSTGPVAPDALAHFAYGAGDVLAVAAYHSPLVRSNGLHGSPWLPVTVGGPRVPYLEYVKIEGKPLVIYETSFFRPYPFRAEWGPMMAAIALRQDWDGVFLYMYGQPWVIYEGSGGSVAYGRKPLPEPTYGASGEFGRYTFGFHHGGDPVTMASWAVGGELFLNTPPGDAPRNQALWDIPLDGVFGSRRGYPDGLSTTANKLELPRAAGFAVRFLRVGQEVRCSPCLMTNADVIDAMEITWGSLESPFRVATPAGAVVVGYIRGALDLLGNGISARVSDDGFGVVARMKHPGDASHVYVIGDLQNSGMQFDTSRIDFGSPAGALSGVLNRGELPFVHAGPTVHLTLDDIDRQARSVSFDLDPEPFKPFHARTIRPGDGVFRLEFAPISGESRSSSSTSRPRRSQPVGLP